MSTTRTKSRRRVEPAVIALDCVALVVAYFVAGPGGIATALLLAALILAGTTAVGYLPVSLPLQLLALVATAVVAASLVITEWSVLDQPVQRGPLMMAAVFAVLAVASRLVLRRTNLA